jgi:hypothetical protein
MAREAYGGGFQSMDDKDELRVWRAERAITRVILCYARGVDRRQFEEVRACFHASARIHYGDWFSGNCDEAIAFLKSSLPNLVSTLHVFGAPWIELDLESGTAEVETYTINSATYLPGEDGLSIQNVSGAKYFDRFAELEGRWAIVERRNRRVWAHNLPDTGEPAPPITPSVPTL